MNLSARSFCQTPNRPGRSIAIIPGKVEGLTGNNLGRIQELTLTPKQGYPNPWVELPIFTHLPGDDPKGQFSRNLLNVGSADIVVVLAGSMGTQAELELACGLRKPRIAFLGQKDVVGTYDFGSLADLATRVEDETALRDQLLKHLQSLS
jgi:SLOG-like protein